MKQISSKFWTIVGWISLLLAAWSFVLATIDGVMAYFVIVVAMIVGGFSSVGAKATVRFAVATAVIGAALIFWMTHYVVSTGFQVPNLSTLAPIIAMITIPLLVSGAMLVWGIFLRRKLSITSTT